MATPETAAKLEEISAAVLTEVIARGKATRFICHTGAMIESVKRLLAAVDFTAPPRADVRVCNLWGAATALQELQELVRGSDDARI